MKVCLQGPQPCYRYLIPIAWHNGMASGDMMSVTQCLNQSLIGQDVAAGQWHGFPHVAPPWHVLISSLLCGTHWPSERDSWDTTDQNEGALHLPTAHIAASRLPILLLSQRITLCLCWITSMSPWSCHIETGVYCNKSIMEFCKPVGHVQRLYHGDNTLMPQTPSFADLLRKMVGINAVDDVRLNRFRCKVYIGVIWRGTSCTIKPKHVSFCWPWWKPLSETLFELGKAANASFYLISHVFFAALSSRCYQSTFGLIY